MKKLIPALSLLFIISSCQINPSVMFKVPKNYEYSNEQTIGNVEYRISPNDILGFSVYTNDGFKLIDLTTSAASISTGLQSSNQGNSQTQFLVEPDGQVKLPIIGKIKIAGFTVREAEKSLEQEYSTFYNKPFVMVKVLNRRVMVFPGTGGMGRTVSLDNENMNLIEALALAGGLTNTGKAYKIKLIRGDLRNPKVMLINLSTVEGMQQSNLLLQANDIIYVEPVPRISQEILSQLAPIIGIITSLALVYQIADGLTNKQ
ncbi:MAG: polysaccharide biosynthesis/export family protein [Bacteroidetes bacterium]|nr:polysaccharide biosynthesis/export family protein [Bacteroidota bacterium]